MISKIISSLNTDLSISIILFVIGHILAWYTHNSQFVWEYWKDKPIIANIVFGVPAGLAFWYGTKYCMLATELLWTSRFIAFALSYATFPLMTWWYLGESFFTTKTLICSFLAFLIIAVQLFIK